MDKIRVALAEDNVLLREGVSRLIAANEDFELVGTASDLPRLLALVAAEHPDVVVRSQQGDPENVADAQMRRLGQGERDVDLTGARRVGQPARQDLTVPEPARHGIPLRATLAELGALSTVIARPADQGFERHVRGP